MIVGISGRARAGKSTLMGIMRLYGAKEVALADLLKNTCSNVFNVPRDFFDDQSKKEVRFPEPKILDEIKLFKILKEYGLESHHGQVKGEHVGMNLVSPRHIAQYVGTDVLRSIDSDIHIKKAFEKCTDPSALYVLSDVRFDNEEAAVKNIAGFIIGIFRKAVEPRPEEQVHASEQQVRGIIDRADYVIFNEGTLEEFENSCKLVIEAILGDYAREKKRSHG